MKENFLKPLTPLEQKIVDYIEPILMLNDVDLIAIRLSGLKGKPHLVLYVDKTSLDELSNLSRLVSDALDVANTEQNWFSGAYQLELSSPGLERLLTKKSHFEPVIGQTIRVKTLTTTLRGNLLNTSPEGISVEGAPNLIPWESIRDANLIYIFTKSPKRR